MPSVGAEACQGLPTVHGGDRAESPRTARVHLRFWLDSDSQVGMEAPTIGGANHRTHWQSEESWLRHHRVPQTTSQRLRRASWAVHRRSPRPSDPADAVFADAWRAGQCFTQFDRLLLQNRTPPVARLTMSAGLPSSGTLEWSRLARGTWPGHCGHVASNGDGETVLRPTSMGR